MGAAVVLAAAPSIAQTQAATSLGAGETLLQVEATGTASAVPDVATITGTVVSDASTARAALSANTQAASRAVAALRDAGVPDRQVRTDDLRVTSLYRKDKDGDDTNEVTGARAVNRIKVKLNRVADAGRVVEALVQAGATELSGPEFGFQDDSAVRRRARDSAVQHAQDQARDYGSAFGLKLARVVRISERASRMDGGQDVVVTGYRVGKAMPPVQPGEQEISVTVWVDYALSR